MSWFQNPNVVRTKLFMNEKEAKSSLEPCNYNQLVYVTNDKEEKEGTQL